MRRTGLDEARHHLALLGYGLSRRGKYYLTFPKASAGTTGYHASLDALFAYIAQVEENRAAQQGTIR